MTKIYSDDPLIKFKSTEIAPERTKAEIDATLGYWQVQDIHWHYNKAGNDVFVEFIIEEELDGRPMKVPVRVDCPIIWDRENKKSRPPHAEEVNWRISMRAMWHFIYTHLNMAYAMQSSKTAAFLPYIVSNTGKTMKEIIIPRLGSISEFEALPVPESVRKREDDKIIDVKPEGEQ